MNESASGGIGHPNRGALGRPRIVQWSRLAPLGRERARPLDGLADLIVGTALFLAFLFTILIAAASEAVPVSYTTPVPFFAALPGSSETLDFNSLVAGQNIPSGGVRGLHTFTYQIGPTPQIELAIDSQFQVLSSPNELGSDDGGVLQGGDDFSLDFAPQSGVGIYFSTADKLEDGDIVLTSGGGTASLIVDDLVTTLSDETDIYFLGLVDSEGPVRQAQITTRNGGFFLYGVDDIVVPEPGLGAGLACGLLTLGWVAGSAARCLSRNSTSR